MNGGGMRWFTLSILAIATMAGGAHARETAVSMVYTNALLDAQPHAIFTKGRWAPDQKSRFVKLHFYFDEPIIVQAVEIDGCGSGLRSPISIFFNFDNYSGIINDKLDGSIRAFTQTQTGDVIRFYSDAEPVEVRSLTVNFEKNRDFEVCGILLKDPAGVPHKITVPELAAGHVEADSVLPPREAYDPVLLFDSRFEHGWASNKKAVGANLRFSFDSPQKVEKIRIWNGYQRSEVHCQANSRAKRIRIAGDGGYSETILVKDQLGSQIIDLPRPFHGKELKFEIAESYRGNRYKDLVISELRFFGDGRWFALDVTGAMMAAIAKNRGLFAKAGLDNILNDSLIGDDRNNYDSYLTLRLRADGSLYKADSTEAGDYFLLGNYEIIDANRKTGIELRVFGLYYQTDEYGDCNGCGRDCNKSQPSDGRNVQKIYQEFMTISSDGEDKFTVLTGGRKEWSLSNTTFLKREE